MTDTPALDREDGERVSHAGITFHYQMFGRAHGVCSCGWDSQTVRFGRYDRILTEWDTHKDETRNHPVTLEAPDAH